MKKATTPSYVLELEASVATRQLREIEARQEVVRVTYNTCLGRLQKRWRSVNGVKEWRDAKNRIQTINRKSEPMTAEVKERKALQQTMARIEKDFELTEYQLHAFVKDVNKHFDRRISSNEAQVTATRAFRAFEKYRYGAVAESFALSRAARA